MNQTEIDSKLGLLAGSQSIGQKHSAALELVNQKIKTNNEALRQALICEKADRFGAGVGILAALAFAGLFISFKERFQYAILLIHKIAALLLAFLAFLVASRMVKHTPLAGSG